MKIYYLIHHKQEMKIIHLNKYVNQNIIINQNIHVIQNININLNILVILIQLHTVMIKKIHYLIVHKCI